MFGGFGASTTLTANQSVRLSVQFYHDTTPTARLSVWALIVPDGSMSFDVLLGRDSWLRFSTHTYTSDKPVPNRPVTGKLHLGHFDNDSGAHAYTDDPTQTGNAFRLYYVGEDIASLSPEPQLVYVNLVRRNGSPALTGHYLVELLKPDDSQTGQFEQTEVFVHEGRQAIYLTSTACFDILNGQLLGYAQAPLLRTALSDVCPPADTSTSTDTPKTPGPPPRQTSDPMLVTNPPEAPDPEPPAALLDRFSPEQRASFQKLWEDIPPHLRHIVFDLSGDGWTPTVIDRLRSILIRYSERFSTGPLDLGRCTTTPFKIKIPEGTPPIAMRPYRTNPLLADKIQVILDGYLSAGLIRHSTSPWASPLVVVRKKNGKIRLTVNYQRLNAVTKIARLPLPRIDEIIDSLGGGKVFSNFDMQSGYHQLVMDPNSIELTAFCTPSGLYEWLVTPQGAAGAPGAFQRVMFRVTDGLPKCHMYLDDAVCHDCTPAEHVEQLASFFGRFEQHNLKLAPSKSRIGATKIEFLGHCISPEGRSPNPNKVAALAKMPMPRDVSQLRSLLGGLSYYRQYLPNLAQTLKPLTTLLKKGVKFVFTSEMETTVRGLLDALSRPPILVFPDWSAAEEGSRPFRLHTDSSRIGFGCTLEQEQADATVRPIVYLSRTTFPNEQNWSVMEQEAGAVVWGVRRLRQYLYDIPFVSYTDHKSLESLAKMAEHNARVQRWFEILSSYNFQLKYRTGPQNANADFLSRLPMPAQPIDESPIGCITDPTEDIVYFISRNGHKGLYTPLSLRKTPAFSMGGLTLTAHASVLGSLRPQSLYSVWNGLPANTVGYDHFRANGQRMVFAAGIDLSGTDSVLPVQVRDLISSRTRGRRNAETATKLAVSGPDLPLPAPVPVPDTFLSLIHI